MKCLHRLIGLFSTVLLVFSTAILLFSCKEEEPETIRVGVLSGPTGMGMAKLISQDAESNSPRYDFHVYSDPSTATADIVGGSLDLLCLPTNTANNLYRKTNGAIRSVAVNCLGSLYVIAKKDDAITSFSDLANKTITASVPSSTTKPILDAMLAKAGISATVDVVADHDALVAGIAKGDVDIAVLPEPKATAALTQNGNCEIKLNLSSVWSSLFDEPLTMGCLVASDAFLKNRAPDLNDFLEAYRTSVEFVNTPENNEAAADMIVAAGVLPKAAIAKSALSHLYGSLVCLTGNEMKSAMQDFFTTIGEPLADDLFYFQP